MPREWRFTARYAAWRTRCADAERARFRSALADALIDRRAIDWSALADRLRQPRAREIADDLLLVERLRGNLAHSQDIGIRARAAVGMAIAIAAVQTACCLAAIGLALVSGASIDGRRSQVALAVSFAAAAVLVGTAARRDRRSLFLVAALCASAGAFARPAAFALNPALAASLAPLLRGVYPEAFVPACLWRLAQDFPHVRRFTTFDVVARRLTASAWFLGCLLLVVNLAGAYGGLAGGPAVLLLRDHPSNLFWSLFALALVPAVVTIVVRSRRADAAERRRISRFAHALAAGSAPLLLCGVARLALPPFDEWIRTAAGPDREWMDRVIVATLLSTPVLGAITLLVDRPFELRALTRSVLLNALERRGLVHGADHRDRLVAALERVRDARGAREIAAVLSRELGQATAAHAVHVFVPSPDGAFVDPLRERPPLEPQSILVALMHETASPLDLAGDRRLAPLLPRSDRVWLAQNAASLAAPLKRRDGTLAAIAVLGSRTDGRTFTRRDRWLVTTLITAAALAWDADASSTTWEEQAAVECPRCGLVGDAPPLACGCGAEPALALVPRHLGGKFVVEQRLGAGGMGVVYRARDTALDRDVAVKTLASLRRATVARLRDEARAMAALNHESLATIYGLEIWRNTPMLIVEYLCGGTLAGQLQRGPLATPDVVRLGIRLARALAYMHAKGVLHRDIKPSNIGFTATGAPKLLDFGLVDAQDWTAGTAAYMPPEARHGAQPSPAFDLWALALVMREATGHVEPEALEAFFARALAREAHRRFQRAEDVIAALGGSRAED